jgi:hypothetical protein
VKRLTAVEALGRGTANVRANRELVGVATAGSLAIVALVFLSFLPWIAALGIDPAWFTGQQPDPEKIGELFEGLFATMGSVSELLARLGGLLLSLSLSLTLASLFFCWYQGGTLGVLVAGDAQAPAGGGREPILFRTWSRRLFLFEARRLTWPLLLFYSLFFGFWLLVGAVTVGIFAGAGLLGSRSGAAAGCALVCGMLLPLMFVSFALYAAMQLGQVDLVRPASSVAVATRAAFSILGRRLGAAAALMSIFVVVSVGFGIAFGVVGLVADLLLSSRVVLGATVRVVLGLVQMAVGAAVGLVFMAAFAALVRSESAIPEPG